MTGTGSGPPDPTADQVAAIEWAKAFEAISPDSFAPAVVALRARYGHKYVIRRSGRLWIATDVDPATETTPTIIEDNLTHFVAALESPGPRVGAPFDHPTQ